MNDAFSPRKPAAPITLDSIRAGVDHCLQLEPVLEPCHHCSEKQYLLKLIEELKVARDERQ